MELQREGASAKDAAALLRMNIAINILDELPNIKAPTLVVHGKQDQAVPIELGREIAQRIPNAQFFAHGGGHYPAPEYREAIFGTMAKFLADTGAIAGRTSPPRTVTATASAPVTTVVFTDIERNTEMLLQLGDAAWRELLREHESITRAQLRQYQGREIKTIGDAFMASFASATDAVHCAIGLQRGFAERNARSAQALNVRVGINAGEPIAEDGDLYGTAVTMASRIAGVAAGGEIIAANVVRELVAGKGFLFADRGDVVLRGFEDPVRLYEVRWHN
jgi:class 3 adenylate cyclase